MIINLLVVKLIKRISKKEVKSLNYTGNKQYVILI